MDLETKASPALLAEFVIAAHGDLDRVQILLGQNPDLLNVPWPRFDETALMAAAHMGRRDIAEYLLAAGAPLTVCCAAMLGEEAEVAAFLAADPALANAQGAHGIPIMFHAAMSGNVRLTDLLLAHGGGDGIDDALHGAIMYGHTEMVAWLLDHGVQNVDALDFQGKTPLRAAMERDYSTIADLLRQRGGTEGAAGT